ncbi:MAG: putative peptidoglycan glycosyltransferase FtsW [Melioribacteraceae bacterium]|nr:cell division protein FtsW [Melioribacteraceae bacterium]MDD3557043.1 putative peptidoglycan glycosyltransferase FtsW [Melioribacteraceae bacterium]
MKIVVRSLAVIVVVLMIIGAAMVFSASGTFSASKTDSIYTMFQSHIWKVLIAVGAMILFSLIPYKHYRDYSKIAMVIVIFILILTFFFAPEIKGAKRWIDLGFLQFQPSSLAKFVLLTHLAVLIEKKGEHIQDFKNGLFYLLVWIGLVAFLVMLQPNVSTSLIIVMLSFILLFVGGARIKHLASIMFTGIVSAGSVMMLFSHSRERIFDFVKGFTKGGEINIQVLQAKIGLGSGGLFGVGIGQSRQSDFFLPEAYGDFIFSIVGEEIGFIGTVLVLFAYLSIFLIGLIVAKKAKDKFGQLLAFAFSVNIVLSAFINAAVVTGLFPTTGITLPFISFGGTSIILFAISVGIIINIGIENQKRKDITLVRVNDQTV